VCKTVYASDGYSASVRTLAQVSPQRDIVFSDGYASQLGTTTGSVAAGYTVSLTAPISP
jgi:hypothetical protein